MNGQTMVPPEGRGNPVGLSFSVFKNFKNCRLKLHEGKGPARKATKKFFNYTCTLSIYNDKMHLYALI